jgi:hypothetical protein
LKYKYLKEWAKEKGYTVTRNGSEISWFKDSDSSVCGQSDLNGEVATAIYNHMTDYKWVEYQKQCKANKVIDEYTFRTYD